MKFLGTLLLTTLMLFTGCTAGADQWTFWYGTSDRYGLFIAEHRKESALVVVTVDQRLIQSYRSQLAAQGMQSDTLGAMQHLVGKQGHHYISGDTDQWDSVAKLLLHTAGLTYTGVRPTVEVYTTLLIRYGELLSKGDAIDTLASLASVNTEVKDIADVLSALHRRTPMVRVHHVQRFLSDIQDYAYTQQWMHQWIDLVLAEAIDRRGDTGR